MISDLRALAYLEYRQIVNRVRQLLRAPGRTLLYVVVIGYFIFVSIMRAHGHAAFPMTGIPEPYASGLFFAYVALLGIMMYGAASGIVGAFESASDARFLNGSALSQRLVVLWLQIRRSGGAIGRTIFTLLLYTIFMQGAGTFTGVALAMIGGTVVATGTAIPMLRLRRAIGTVTAQGLGAAVAAIGILPMVLLFSSLASKNIEHAAVAIEHFGPGFAFNALFDGRPPAIGALYLCAVLLILLSYACGGDLYPELYAASMRVLEFRDRHMRASGGTFAIQHEYEQRAARISPVLDALRGSWTLAWKEWIAFARSPSMQRSTLFGILASAAVGVLFGRIVAQSHDQLTETLQLGGMVGNLVIIFVAMGSAIGLSSDISKPLWWIGRDPLWMRLTAWTAATSWRLAACMSAGLAAWAITLRSLDIAAIGIPLAVAISLHLRAIGLLLYSLFPSTLDQRGPLAIVRFVLTYILATPPSIAAAVYFFYYGRFHHPVAALAVGILVSLTEMLLLVAFAAKRISGQGVAFARAETY
jgi:hypothetical protein